MPGRNGGSCYVRAQLVNAAKLFGAVEALLERMGVALTSLDRVEYERHVVAVRAHLDETRLAAAWAEGRAMTLEQAAALAQSTGSASDAASSP